MPPSHQQHGQQVTRDRARGRSYTSTTSRRGSAGALHSPGMLEPFFLFSSFFKFASLLVGGGSHEHDALR